MAHPGNPMEKAHITRASTSKVVYSIAGIQTTVYGLDELPKGVNDLACLWLLHPRLQTEKSMAIIAAESINHWNQRSEVRKGSRVRGLIAISFDQRNHGGRLVNAVANDAWRQGNSRHAQDMFSIYQGTAADTSLLITHISSYLPANLPIPNLHLVLGVSLGAHAAWHNILHDDRIGAAAIIIGCPDFARLMAQRASKSKLADWNAGPPPQGSRFFSGSSSSFPPSMLAAVDAADPAGLLLPVAAKAPSLPPLAQPSPQSLVPAGSELLRLRALLAEKLKNKAVMNLAGGSDKLVPYSCSEPFWSFLKRAIDDKDGWWRDSGLTIDDRVFAGVGHEVTPEMARTAVQFLGDVLAEKIRAGDATSRSQRSHI